MPTNNTAQEERRQLEPQPLPAPVVTSPLAFVRATKHQAKLRLTLDGPSGSGKTYSALSIASALGKRIALIDTEHGSASKYAGDPFVFDTVRLDSFEPRTYVQHIKAAEAAGYDVLIIDSLSHAWAGKGGALEQVDKRADVKGNKFAAWRYVTPMHNELVDAILGARLHVIATMRTKTEYAMDENQGKTTVRKIGTAPIQRDGIDYEFDVVGDLDLNHNLHITKTRCKALDDAIIAKPGAQIAETLKGWLDDGAPAPAQPPEARPAAAKPKTTRKGKREVVPLEHQPEQKAESSPGVPTPETDGGDARTEAIVLTPEQRKLLVNLGNTLDVRWPAERYADELLKEGGFLPVRDKLLGLHREQHGNPDQHWGEAIMAAGSAG